MKVLLAASDLFADEGLEGIVENEIHAGIIRKLALAAGVELLAKAGSTIATRDPA